MAETAGETFVFIILFVIFIFVIVLIFAYFLLFGFGFTNSTSCYASSQVTNFFYNDLCITQFFCIASTLQNLGITPPLLGCSASTQTYTSSSTSGEALSGVTEGLETCWYQYGGEQGLSVLPGSSLGSPQQGAGTALCSVIHLNLNQNITFYNLTQYLKSIRYTTKVSCLNHTAQQSCANYQNGFTCDVNSPNLCEGSSNNYFNCLDQQNYNPIYQGYTLQNIFLNGSKTKTTAANNISDYLCQESQGCYFNTSFDSCVNLTGKSASCQQTFQNFCQTYPNGNYNCTLDYNPYSDTFIPPPSCTMTEPVNNNSIINVSYFDYLSPGVNLIYSYKNKSTSSNGVFVSSYSNASINNAQLYIVFLNSFAGTSYPPQIVSTPSECSPIVFLNNYPNNGIEDECSRALVTYAGLVGKFAYGKTGLLTLFAAGLGGYAYGQCAGVPSCKQYVDTNYPSSVSTLFLTTSGLSGCVQSLYVGLQEATQKVSNSFLSMFGVNSVENPLNFLGRNQLYICAVVS